MKSNARIIIKPGGKLVIDGGIITTEDNHQWQGIEVWGDYYTHQFPTNGSYGQGYLEMKKGATIENAIYAVELWRPDYWSTTGGIIHATDATFRNNATSIHALHFSNYDPYNTNEEMPYNSFFENCNFVIDEDYLGTVDFTRHVSLDNVKGIVFRGCDFSVDRDVAGVDPWCMGIHTNDAGFTVTYLCTSTAVMPCLEEYMKESTFTGFCSGIRAISISNNPRSFHVRNSVFTDNDRGIYAANTGFPTILMNEFNIRRDNDYCTSNYGIYLNNVTGFSIEENSFQPVSGTGGSTIGIAICNSKSVNDIYRNDFSGLSQANLALGKNYIDNINGRGVPGLTYTCNTFSGNQQDILVLKEDGVGNIQTAQGSSAIPAGNTFNSSVSQIYNDGTLQINYYYNSNNTDETPNSSLVYRVNLNGTTNANPCQTHYGNGPILRSALEKAALASDYLSAYTAYQDLNRLYESRIDGGNTSVQLANINGATSSDMWRLRAQLLGLSPYVSKRVLTSAADRDDVFTDPVLFEILAANPDELRDDSLISYLESKAHPLSGYMIDLLRQMASGSTARTALMAQMDRYWHEYSLAAGDIVRSILNDTVANPTELRQWLGNMNDIAADRMVIASYLQEGDSVSAFSLANMLPALYGLQGEQLSDHADYIRLIQLYQNLNRTHRTVYELTATETNMVNGIAEEGVGVSRLMARSLLETVTGEMMETCLDPEVPETLTGSKGGANIGQSSIDNAVGFTVNVSPNPATTWVVVDYTLPSKMSRASMVVTNTLGITVMSTELNGDQGHKVLDLRDLADGVYFVRVTDVEKHSKIVKLVKQK